MATTGQIRAAQRDQDIIERLRIVAAQKGERAGWVDANLSSLVGAAVNDSSVAEVYEYACAQYKGTPGSNPEWITDALLSGAIDAVLVKDAPPAENV